jgi:DNA-binding winged helix-turn-helix (wHTH) protein
MVKLTDLAARPDLRLGAMLVSPSRRLVQGPGGEVHLEPLVMQVLLLLLDARGNVVTRTELFDQVWGGVIVGDDSLNRVIAKVRRVGEVAPGLLEIETIPRTGYRVKGKFLDYLHGDAASTRARGMSRRQLVGGASAGALAAGAVGLWWLPGERPDRRFERLIAQAEQGIRSGALVEELIKPGDFGVLRQAIGLRPDSAKAWGLLAYVKAVGSDDAKPEDAPKLVKEAQSAAAKARSLDPREPNAMLALAFLQGSMFGWNNYDAKLREVMAINPGDTKAIGLLVALTQAAGLNRESWLLNERALALEPMSATYVARKALKLWIAGNVQQSHRVIDRAFDLWPSDPTVLGARFIILAFTDRTQASRAMLDDNPTMLGSPAVALYWQRALSALERPTPEAIAAVTRASMRVAGAAPGLAAQSVMVLGALRQVGPAFEIANGFLLSRGKIVTRAGPNSRSEWVRDPSWKWTQWLFTPAAASLRADRQFVDLCVGIGLTDYWRARNVRPDYLLDD